MSDQNDITQTTKRRKVLKSVGAVTAFSGVGVSVASAKGQAKRNFDKIVDQSHRILEKEGVEKQHEFLRRRRVSTAKDTITYKMPTAQVNTENQSTQDIPIGDISLNFSIFSDCYHDRNHGWIPDGTYKAELSWHYDSPLGGAIMPVDIIGIGWDDNTWYYEDNNSSDIYSNYDDISYRSGTSGNGPAWDVHDGNLISEDGYYYAGVDLVWNGSESQKQNRTIAASYTHTWSEITITGVSVGFPLGASVSVSDEEHKWTKGRNDDGDFLRLRHDDLGGCL